MRTNILFLFILVFTISAVADVPAPNSFYDFEETEGTTVIDQGSAANNGEIVEGSGVLVRSTGGIFTKPDEGRGCIEFTEENAFGELVYIFIPFKDFMNSPNYTFSAWIQYVGAPNWGYVFWMGGDVWPEDPMERHVDVWLNPGNNGVDCILNSVDGSQPRVATLESECGIGVMDGEWHLVTITLINGVSMKFYLDGIIAAETEATAEIVINSGDDLYLGARPNDADALTSVKLVGLMDRVRIWDVALDDSQNEMLYLMEGPNGGSVGVVEKPSAPQTFALLSNYPNPFNPNTTISFSLDNTQDIHLDVFDASGRKIRTLAQGIMQQGRHSMSWNGADDNGNGVPSGIYFCRLTGNGKSELHKMSLIR